MNSMRNFPLAIDTRSSVLGLRGAEGDTIAFTYIFDVGFHRPDGLPSVRDRVSCQKYPTETRGVHSYAKATNLEAINTRSHIAAKFIYCK